MARPVNSVIYSPEALNDLYYANSYWQKVNVLMLQVANRMDVIDKCNDYNEPYDPNIFKNDCRDIFMLSHHCVHDIMNSM